MSLITVKLLANPLSLAEKRELIEKLTEAAVAVEGEALRATTCVIVEEIDSGAWGIGGSVPTSEDVRALRANAVIG